MEGIWKSQLVERTLVVVGVLLAVYLSVQALDTLGVLESSTKPVMRTISVEGEGKIFATPNIATVTYTITSDKPTAQAAQQDATTQGNKVLKLVRDLGVEDKDIKTTNYSIYPKYENVPAMGMPQMDGSMYYPPTNPQITGYTVSQTIELKVRAVDKVPDVVKALGTAGVGNVYGPNFTVDDMDELREQARVKAIDDAREEAEKLARQLGVRLGKVQSFSASDYYYDGGNSPASTRSYDLGSAEKAMVAAPEVPLGSDEIKMRAYITYEIR